MMPLSMLKTIPTEGQSVSLFARYDHAMYFSKMVLITSKETSHLIVVKETGKQLGQVLRVVHCYIFS